jgi:hypothetical protein
MFSPVSRTQLANRYFFSSGERASDDYKQFWIRYKPGRALKKRGKNASQLFLLANVFFLVAAAVSLLCQQHLLFAGLLFFLVALNATRVLSPTHISLAEEGLQLHWLRSYCNIHGPLIGWDRLSHVSIADQPGPAKLHKQPSLEFNILATGIPFQKRLTQALLAPGMVSGWLKGDRCSVRFKLDGIASSDDRKRLQMALKKFLPSYRIDPSVTDELNLSIRVENYTDLWLDALSTSPKRLRENVLSPGTKIIDGRYEVVRQMGGGGQAVIYEAISRTSAGHGIIEQTKVVLKEFVLPAHAGVNVRKRVLGNIQREADMLKDIQHPNVVSFLGFYVEDQRAYLVLEHLEGVTLKEHVLETGAMPATQTVQLALQMCYMLSKLHSKSPPIVHRDFTPDNLMIDANQNLKLIDFNVAQQLEANTDNSVVGKHAFIPPEQFRGKSTPQSDIYALGATLFFMLTGEEPEPISQSHPRAHDPKISEDLDRIVATATATEPTERYLSCDALLKDLLDCA